MFHWADSRVIPRHCIGTDSKSSAGGCASVSGFAITLTAGVELRVLAEGGGVGGVGSSGTAWTPCSRQIRGALSSSGYSEGEDSWSKLGAKGDEIEPAFELNVGEPRPLVGWLAGLCSSGKPFRASGVTDRVVALRVRGPPGRRRGEVSVEKREEEEGSSDMGAVEGACRV